MDESWLDLLNSDWHDHLGSGRSEDRLDNPVWLARFLARQDIRLPAAPNRDVREGLRDLRTLIRRMVDAAAAGRPVAPRDRNRLNAVLADGPSIHRLEGNSDGFRLGMVPVTQDLASLLAGIARAFARILADGDPTRIKVCENTDCRWVFYDRSRNRSRRWCESEACGNLMKVRRFRERRKTRRQARRKG